MEHPLHSMSNLFAQLGEANDALSIQRFIDSHRPVSGGVLLYEADFWSAAQASFLKDAWFDDADWAEVTDELNMALHTKLPARH